MNESILTRRLQYEDNNRLRLPGDACHLYKRSYPIFIKKYLSRHRCMGSTASYEDLRGTGLITSDSQVWLQR